MTEYYLQKIRWNDGGSFYLYGSSIQYNGDDVIFENLRFASGKKIKSWVSRTNFQGNRQSPCLPLLVPGCEYRLEKNFSVEPDGSVYLQLEFRNRQEEVVGLTILKDDDDTFTYPKDAFTYSLTLFSAGCQRVHFSSIVIYALEKVEVFRLESGIRGYYAKHYHLSDIEFVKSLINEARNEKSE
ncbi:TPA: accessory Sec system protein Asp3 [Streptococcus suis]